MVNSFEWKVQVTLLAVSFSKSISQSIIEWNGVDYVLIEMPTIIILDAWFYEGKNDAVAQSFC